MRTSIKRSLVSFLTLVFSICLALSIASFTSNKVSAQEANGFAINEKVMLQPDENGGFLRYETAVSNEWIDANPSNKYTFGTLIFPSYNGEYDANKTIAENELALDAVNVIIMEDVAVSEGFTYKPAIFFDYETIGNWAIGVKPELENDEEAFWTAIQTVLNHLMEVEFTAVSYAVTDGGVITSNPITCSINNAEYDDGKEDVEITPPSFSEFGGQEVTEEEFYKAVSFANASSFSGYGIQEGIVFHEDETYEVVPEEAFLFREDDKWSNYYPGMQEFIYMETVGSDHYAYYVRAGQTAMRSQIPEEQWPEANMANFFIFNKDMVDFAQFSYSDGYYEGPVTYGNGESGRVTFAFLNGEVEYFKVIRFVEEVEVYSEYRIYNRNATAVQIPTDFIDQGGGSGGEENYPEFTEEDWAGLFNFDDVTISYEAETQYPSFEYEGETYPSSWENDREIIEISYSEWLISKRVFDGMAYTTQYVYHNGEKTFVDGVEDETYADSLDNALSVLDLSEAFLAFERVEYSRFVAKLPFDGGGIYDGYYTITVNANERQLDSVEIYVEGIVVDDSTGYVLGETFSQSKRFYFSNWGSTYINGSSYGELTEWAKQFDVKNATITTNCYALIGEEPLASGISANYKIDNGAWLANVKMAGGMPGSTMTGASIYYDGTTYYQDGIMSEYPLDNFIRSLLMIREFLEANKLAFTETIDGDVITYTADGFDDSFAGALGGVEFTVVNGKIATLEFIAKDDYYDVSEDKYYDLLYVYNLTDLDATTIDRDAYFEEFAFTIMFNITNATIKITETDKATSTVISTTDVKVDGYKWIYDYKLIANESGNVYVWYDNCYTVIGNVVYMHNQETQVYDILDFIMSLGYYEDSYTATEDDGAIYYNLSENVDYNGLLYKDVTVKVVDGVIVSITLTKVEYVGEETVEVIVNYDFSAYLETTVGEINPDEFEKSEDFNQGGGVEEKLDYQSLFNFDYQHINLAYNCNSSDSQSVTYITRMGEDWSVTIEEATTQSSMTAQYLEGTYYNNGEPCEQEAISFLEDYAVSVFNMLKSFASFEPILEIEGSYSNAICCAEFIDGGDEQSFYNFSIQVTEGKISNVYFYIVDDTCFDEGGNFLVENATEVNIDLILN